MKKMNLKSMLSYTIIFNLLGIHNLYALGVKRSDISSSTATSNSPIRTVVTNAVAERKQVNTTTAVVAEECSPDQSGEKVFPVEFMNNLFRDESSKLDISIEKKKKKIKVNMPPFYKGCGRIIPTLTADTNGSAIISLGVASVTYGLDDKKVTTDGSYGQFLKCLRDKEIVKKDENSEFVSHVGVEAKEYESISYEIPYSIPDVKKSVKLGVAYPKSFRSDLDMAPANDIDSSMYGGGACLEAEKISKDDTYLNEGQDVVLKKVAEVCKSGDAQKMAEAKEWIGNADSIADIADKIQAALDASMISAKGDKVKDAIKRLDEIDKYCIDHFSDMTPELASKKAADYRAELEKLSNDFLDPAIIQLDKLMGQRDAIKDDNADRRALDKEIEKLNSSIGEYSNKARKDGIYKTMAKYAVVDDAKYIEDIRARSDVYSRVYPPDSASSAGRGKAISFDKAEKMRNEDLRDFDKLTDRWIDGYRAANGDYAPVKRAAAEFNSIYKNAQKMQKNFAETEDALKKRYCSGFYSQDTCNKKYWSGYNQRMNKYTKALNAQSAKGQVASRRYDSLNNAYENKKAEDIKSRSTASTTSSNRPWELEYDYSNDTPADSGDDEEVSNLSSQTSMLDPQARALMQQNQMAASQNGLYMPQQVQGNYYQQQQSNPYLTNGFAWR
jgi:hypothetical protein